MRKHRIKNGIMLRTASALAMIGPFVATAASAQTAPQAEATAPSEAQETPEASDGQDIVVTGVRGQARSVIDSPTPVDVIGARDLETGGRANLYQNLQVLVPSFNQPSKSGSGTGSAIQTGGLRGLNPDHTLVLINGTRRHHTSLINISQALYNGSVPVDLGMIPSSGIDRIEVLREGAAAQYGSDAIAGVININLKKAPGGSISAQYGQNFDRSDGELLVVRGDYGLEVADTGNFNVFFLASTQEQSDRSFPIASTIQIYPRVNGQPDPREATVNRQINKSFGAFPYRLLSGGFNFENEFNDVTVYSFGIFNKRRSEILYPPQIPNSGTTGLPEIYPDIFYPNLILDEVDAQLALGARGQLAGWDWNLSSSFGQNRAKESLDESLNASIGPSSPTSFYLGTLVSKEWTNSLDLTRKYEVGSGSLQVSFGAQHRYDAFAIEAGEPSSYIRGTYVRPAGQPFATTIPTPGAQSVPGFRPADAGSWDRNILGLYAEIGYDPSERFFIGASGRYERFSDTAGSSLVGKVLARYELTDWLAVRGSIGNGFRAPALAQTHYSNARSSVSTAPATLGQTIITATIPVDSPAAVALGATSLRPEKSVDASVGVTLTPAPGLTLTVDGYIVKLDDRIALTGILQGTAVNNILVANGLQPNLAAQYFTNAIDTRTKGFDIVASYRTGLGSAGDLRLTAAFNYNKTQITSVIPTPAALTALGSSYVLIDRVTRGYLEDGIPETKVALGANWTISRFELNLQGIRYGEFSVRNNTIANDRTFPAEFITNVSVKYRLSDKVSLSAGADNLFNIYPPDTAIARLDIGTNQYPRTSPYGFTGGSYWARVQFDF